MLIAKRNTMSRKKMPYARRLAWIQGNGSSYIDPNLTFSIGSKFIIDVLEESFEQCFFGANSGGGEVMINWGNGYHFLGGGFSYPFSYGVRHKIEIDMLTSNLKMLFDGVTVRDVSGRVNNLNAYICGGIISSTTPTTNKARYYGFEHYNTEGLTKRLIPVMSHEGNAEMFDEVTQTFAERHGDFLYGELGGGGGYKCIRSRFSRSYGRFRASRTRLQWKEAA